MDYQEVQCRSCGALIVWMKTTNDRPIPVDASTVKFGDKIFDAKRGHVAHFATCPNASEHRKPKSNQIPLAEADIRAGGDGLRSNGFGLPIEDDLE